MMSEADRDKLARFLNRIRQVWKARDAAGRRELERRFDGDVGDMFSARMWKSRYDELSARYDETLKAEIGEARHILARVTKLLDRTGNRKTLRTDDLTMALSKCAQCTHRDATRMTRGQPTCDEDYAEMQERGLA